MARSSELRTTRIQSTVAALDSPQTDASPRAVRSTVQRSSRDGSHPLRSNVDLTHKHTHGANCGHHYFSNRWNDFPRHHKHGANCGHHKHNGVWLSFSIGHTHGTGCGHFYDSGRWLSHSSHRHGAGCGHYFYNGLWNNHSRHHSHSSSCGHYSYDGGWHDFPRSHVHNAHCGHLYDGVRWYIHGHSAHIHGPSCGCHYYHGRWNRYAQTRYITRRRSSFFFFIDLGGYRERNLPSYVYEEYRYDNGPSRSIFNSSQPIDQAYSAFAAGSYHQSIIEFNRAIRREHDNGLLYLARGQAYFSVKNYRSAYEDIVKGMELIPEWSEVSLNLNELYNQQTDFEKQLETLEKWVESYPRDHRAHFVLGYMYYYLQEYGAAKTELTYVLAWDKEHPQANNLLNQIFHQEAESDLLF